MMSVVEQIKGVTIQSQFRRSINIKEDMHSEELVQNYIVTPGVDGLAKMIVQSLADPNGSRAWSITGPYGSGKSAFCLFMIDILSTPDHIRREKHAERTYSFGVGRLRPVLVTGHRGRIAQALLVALADAIEELDDDRSADVRQAISEVTSDQVWGYFHDAIITVREHGYDGLFIVIDEFGQFLEYVGSHPESEDLIALQYLAEEVDRNPGEFLLFTILHSAFSDYIPKGNQVMRTEWQKIQGRFQDVVFTTSLNQHLTLLSSAIKTSFVDELNKEYDRLFGRILKPTDLSRLQMNDTQLRLLRKCIPLHPITSLITWPIFRGKMAQNERSLFSFLTSNEYKGFTWFSDRHSWAGPEIPIYFPSDLYDYVATALGTAVSFGQFSKGWAEIAATLDQLDAFAPDCAAEVVKVIGLLNMYGPAVGLDATRDVLGVAVRDADAVEGALEYLIKEKLVLYRRYNGTYRLWEGSDIDLDQAYQNAVHQLAERSIAERLRSLVELRPMVARKHYVETGTLRAFEVNVIDGSTTNLKDIMLNGTLDNADGRIVYVLTKGEAERSALIKQACKLTKVATKKGVPVILAFLNWH
ncbi:MAG: hypothetical protein ACOX44_10700 [Limnochordia bacterium]